MPRRPLPRANPCLSRHPEAHFSPILARIGHRRRLADGRRFVNEALNYHDAARVFANTDALWEAGSDLESYGGPYSYTGAPKVLRAQCVECNRRHVRLGALRCDGCLHGLSANGFEVQS